MPKLEERIKDIVRDVVQPYLYDGPTGDFSPEKVGLALLDLLTGPNPDPVVDSLIEKLSEKIEEEEECDVSCEEVKQFMDAVERKHRLDMLRGCL